MNRIFLKLRWSCLESKYLESPRNANPNNDPHCHPNHRHHLPHLRWIRYWLKRLLQEKVASHLFHENGSVVNFVKYVKYVKGTSADIDILLGLRRSGELCCVSGLVTDFSVRLKVSCVWWRTSCQIKPWRSQKRCWVWLAVRWNEVACVRWSVSSNCLSDGLLDLLQTERVICPQESTYPTSPQQQAERCKQLTKGLTL